MRTARVAPLLALLLLAAPARGFQREERVPARPGGALEVEADLGSGLRPDRGWLSVSTHPADEVRVRVEADGWASWDVDVSLEPLPEKVRLDVRVSGATSWMFGGPQVRVHVFVPERTRVEVRSSGADLRVEDLVGRVRGRVRDGAVELRGVEGPVKMRVVGGDLLAEEVHGDLEVLSSDGDVRATWVQGGVEARTDDGDITLEHVAGPVTAKSLDGSLDLSEVEGPVTAHTERGAVSASFSRATGGSLETERGVVSVVLPEGAGAALDARVTEGTVDLAPGLSWHGQRQEGRAVGTLGGGGPRLFLRSSRGEIRVSGR